MRAKLKLEESFRIGIDDDTFELSIGQFLDDFYTCANNIDRYNMVKDRPHLGNMNRERLLAAIVDEICTRFEVEKPGWIEDKSIKDEAEPLFYNPTNKVLSDRTKIIMMIESPVKFKERNVFAGKQFLVRY